MTLLAIDPQYLKRHHLDNTSVIKGVAAISGVFCLYHPMIHPESQTNEGGETGWKMLQPLLMLTDLRSVQPYWDPLVQRSREVASTLENSLKNHQAVIDPLVQRSRDVLSSLESTWKAHQGIVLNTPIANQVLEP